uniref:Lipoprotein n=1 Tax=Cystobacter fuscus TaxID=43 RepID=A0A3S7UX24_9BACT|nr:lipoprotein [Cystobacter fuscus]
MSSRFLLLVGLVACLSVGCRDQGAVKLTISFPNFKPGCIRVSVKDAQGAGEERSTELQEQLVGKKRGEQVTVAAFREEGWGPTLTVTATAFEQQCSQGPEFVASNSVNVGRGVAPVELKLEAVDGDDDGYVSVATGGTDCDDGEATVRPGQVELCNNTRDDNCDGKTNEGFEKLGQQCSSPQAACQIWACDTQGAMSCQASKSEWFRDEDGDGEGNPQQALNQCAQPAGYVNNSLDCDDKRKERYSTATELCNGVNDNCDDVIDEGFNTGAACSGELGCAGKVECVTTTQATCKVVTSTWYPDADKDSHGATGAGITLCGTTPPGSYYVTSSDDCDDTKSNVYTGAPELCDTLDNNCDSQTDEGFDVGGTCTDDYQCAGTKQCSTDKKSSLCISPTTPTQYYADNDSDNYGDNNSVIKTCGTPSAGYITQGGDCNDGNPFTHPNAAELCDKEDNDCDAATNETSVCPAGAKWADYSSAGADTWRSVALYGNGGVWVVGGNKFHQFKPGGTGFNDLSTSCTAGEDVNTVTATPGTGDALLGGDGGFLARYDPLTNQCVNPGKQSVDTNIKGATAIPVGNDVEAHFVGLNTDGTTDKGRAFRVLTPQGSDYDKQSLSETVWDVHGRSQDALFAVGGETSSRIYRFDSNSGNWSTESVPSGGLTLMGVWVVNPKLAYAVGYSGTLFSWNGATWSKVSGAPNDNLTSVVAFGSRSIYVTAVSGRVYRYNGSAWTELVKAGGNSQLLDIAANNPGDIWVVGNNGKRYHWPQ